IHCTVELSRQRFNSTPERSVVSCIISFLCVVKHLFIEVRYFYPFVCTSRAIVCVIIILFDDKFVIVDTHSSLIPCSWISIVHVDMHLLGHLYHRFEKRICYLTSHFSKRNISSSEYFSHHSIGFT